MYVWMYGYVWMYEYMDIDSFNIVVYMNFSLNKTQIQLFNKNK